MTALQIPDHIIVTVYFSEYSSREKRNIPNDTRRCLMGLGHVPSLPEKVNSRIGSESIFPVEFSLVKGEHGGPKGMTKMAVGATTKYGYVGPSDRINQTVDQIRDVCRELKNSESLKWSKFEVYLARRIISE